MTNLPFPLLLAALGHHKEHAEIVHRSPPGLKAAVLITCFLVLAWLLRSIFKRN